MWLVLADMFSPFDQFHNQQEGEVFLRSCLLCCSRERGKTRTQRQDAASRSGEVCGAESGARSEETDFLFSLQRSECECENESGRERGSVALCDSSAVP